ncbi:unnamed protein product [Hyaloperonospora brassicae]|uniref:Enoyl-CoA hydratase/isomerase family protein n=1 Tax=Hyaloperonospora brassicae TaxID=162125 RepID=A0AAV0UZZ3_HYABA|nr:unnamed protein product [Hyaloperonospora brassicae]
MADAERFAFMNDPTGDRSARIAATRSALRPLSRCGDRVVLYLPFLCSRHVDTVRASLPVELQALEKTAVLEIESPLARNALSGKMMVELADIVELLEDPEVHDKLTAVLVRGTNGWFCAGADLKVAQQAMTAPEAGDAMGQLMTDTLSRFRRLPLVSIACIEGGAYGGGAELACACDFRLVEKNAVIQFVQVRIGVSPAWGGGVWLYKIVGRQAALRLLCTAEKLSAPRAQELKLADFVFDAALDGAEAAIRSFLTPFDAVAPAVSHGAKRVIDSADDVGVDAVLSREHDIFKSLWGGPINLEALHGALKSKEK